VNELLARKIARSSAPSLGAITTVSSRASEKLYSDIKTSV